MARHKRYNRSARLSRRTVSAAFDSSFEYTHPAFAMDAAAQLWEHFGIKATYKGNVVYFETPKDGHEAEDVDLFLQEYYDEAEDFDPEDFEPEDLQASRRPTARAAFDSSAQFRTEAAAEAMIDMMWEYYRVKATRTGTTVYYEEPRDLEQLDDMLEMINDIIEQDELYEDQFGPAKPGDAEAFGVSELDEFADDDESGVWDEFDARNMDEPFDDDEGEEWKSGEPIAFEPEDFGYEAPKKVEGPWKPRGPWVDLVIDYSQLPNEDALLKYARREGMHTLTDEQLEDVVQMNEGESDHQDFVTALLEMQRRGLDAADMWWDYLRAYRYAQENRGVGLSRLLRRVKHHRPAAEAARRIHKRK